MTLAEIKSQIIAWIRTGIPKNVKSSNMRTLLTWIGIRMDVQEVGRLKIIKIPGNTSHLLEEGDKVTGIVENTHIINAIYLGGNINLLESYALVNDPGYLAENPTENEYADIDALKAGQANQTAGFNQKVLDPSDDPDAKAGEAAVYFYKGGGNAALTDYIRLSDSDSSLSNFVKKGGNNTDTAKSLRDSIDSLGENLGVLTVSGDGVDNTDPDNPVISFPDADEIDDSATTNKFVTQAEKDKIAGLDQAVVLKNTPFDASIGTFPANTEAGWAYIVGTAGTVDGIDFEINDRLISLVDNASTNTFAGNWFHADYSDVSFKAEIEASSSKTTPVDADIFGFLDSAASFIVKKFTWANLKAALKTYFDTLYAPIGDTYTPPADYTDMDELYDNQGEQETGLVYRVANASAHSEITHSGWAEFKKLATSTGAESDYDLRDQEDFDSGITDEPIIVNTSRPFAASDIGKILYVTASVTLTWPAAGIANFKTNIECNDTGAASIVDENTGADLSAPNGTELAADETAYLFIEPVNSKLRISK